MSFRGVPEPERYHSIDLQHPEEKRRSSEDSNAPLSPRPMNDQQQQHQQPVFPTPSAQVHIQEPTRYPPEPRVNHASFTKLPEPNPDTSGRPTPYVCHTTIVYLADWLRCRSRSSSWDLFGGIQKDWEGFDSRNASEAHLQFADGKSQSSLPIRSLIRALGDMPKNKV